MAGFNGRKAEVLEGRQAAALEYGVGSWVRVVNSSRSGLVGKVVRVRSVTENGLLIVEQVGKLEGDLVRPEAVERYDGVPPATDRVPLRDDMPANDPVRADGLSEETWRGIVAQQRAVSADPVPANSITAPPPQMEELAAPPALVDEDQVVEVVAASRRGPQSEEHRQAIREGKARARAERERMAAHLREIEGQAAESAAALKDGADLEGAHGLGATPALPVLEIARPGMPPHTQVAEGRGFSGAAGDWSLSLAMRHLMGRALVEGEPVARLRVLLESLSALEAGA